MTNFKRLEIFQDQHENPWNALLIMDNIVARSLNCVGRGELFGFSTLRLSNITVVFLPLIVTSVEQSFG
jgi:hypothetical protein